MMTVENALKDALRAHRLEQLASLLNREGEVTGRVAEAKVVRKCFVVNLFYPWPEMGTVSLWFSKPPAQMGFPEDPAAWVGKLVRVRGVIREGKAIGTFWLSIKRAEQIVILAEEPVAEGQ